MKIAWFTPFSQKSAISNYSRIITNKLINSCNVDLWLSEEKDLLPTELKVFHYHSNDDLSYTLNNYDFIVYNIGNNIDFHKEIYEISKKHQGIIIMHDFVMHHFFASYYLEHKSSPNRYIQDMKLLYGVDGRNRAVQSIKGKRPPVWETEKIIKYPFFEKAIEGAIGVITHSHYLADVVKRKFLGPVDIIYHPYSFDNSITLHKTRKIDVGIPEDKILMLTVGHVNPNKRIDKVIQILGSNEELRRRTIYVIIGFHENARYYAQLKSLVAKYRLTDSVTFLGFQPDETLYAYMSAADFFINLRFPAYEGAPWSLVEQLYCGKPVIVTDTGFYSELPNDSVMKTTIRSEVKDIYQAIERLINNRNMRKEIGARGKKFAVENFTIDKYCHKFFGFLKKVKKCKPLLELIDTVGLELAAKGVSEDMDIIDTVSQKIYKIFIEKKQGGKEQKKDEKKH